MALAVKVGVTLPAVSGWERNLYKPRRPTAQRLDDELRAGGAVLGAFGYAPLPNAATAPTERDGSESRVLRLERRVADLSDRLDQLQQAIRPDGGPDRRTSLD